MLCNRMTYETAYYHMKDSSSVTVDELEIARITNKHAPYSLEFVQVQ